MKSLWIAKVKTFQQKPKTLTTGWKVKGSILWGQWSCTVINALWGFNTLHTNLLLHGVGHCPTEKPSNATHEVLLPQPSSSPALFCTRARPTQSLEPILKLRLWFADLRYLPWSNTPEAVHNWDLLWIRVWPGARFTPSSPDFQEPARVHRKPPEPQHFPGYLKCLKGRYFFLILSYFLLKFKLFSLRYYCISTLYVKICFCWV